MTDDLDSVTEIVNQAILDTVEEVSGRERKKIQPCITDHILELCDKRRSLKPIRFEPQKHEEYKKVDQAIRKDMTKVQENWLQQKCDKIEKETINGNSKEVFKRLRE